MTVTDGLLEVPPLGSTKGCCRRKSWKIRHDRAEHGEIKSSHHPCCLSLSLSSTTVQFLIVEWHFSWDLILRMAASLWQAVMGSTPKEDLYSGIEFWSDPERTGWLTKQGEYIKTWRRRWFVLKQGKLFWFKESTINRGSKPRGVIPVNTCLTVKGAEDVLNKQFAFELSTNSETMYFIADSEKEKEDWINSIGRSIVQHSRSVTDSEVVDYDNRRGYKNSDRFVSEAGVD